MLNTVSSNNVVFWSTIDISFLSEFKLIFEISWLSNSIFIAFAPKEDPKIALAVYVENGGWGATWAAPIATLMIEKYLKNKISNISQENFILNGVVDVFG